MKAKLSLEVPLALSWRRVVPKYVRDQDCFRLLVLTVVGWAAFGNVKGLVFIMTGKYSNFLIGMGDGRWSLEVQGSPAHQRIFLHKVLLMSPMD